MVALAIPTSLLAGTSTQMTVSVQVVARTIVTVEQQPPAVEVTSTDVARGYVDVPSAVAFRIRSNARNGYALQFAPVAAPFSAARVSWSNTTVNVGNDGSWVTQPYQPAVTTTGTMSVRLALEPGTAPGTYAWPVSFAADSL
jgi:hypothetical protein